MFLIQIPIALRSVRFKTVECMTMPLELSMRLRFILTIVFFLCAIRLSAQNQMDSIMYLNGMPLKGEAIFKKSIFRKNVDINFDSRSIYTLIQFKFYWFVAGAYNEMTINKRNRLRNKQVHVGENYISHFVVYNKREGTYSFWNDYYLIVKIEE